MSRGWSLAGLVATFSCFACASSAPDEPAAGAREPLLELPIQLDFADQAGEAFGTSIAGLGDVDGDKKPDILIGAPGWGTPLGFAGEGRAYLWSSATPSDKPTWTADPADEDKAAFGRLVVAAGDVNGDGFADAVIASNNNVFAFHGGSSGLGASPVWLVSAPYAGIGAGDVDGDGFSDVVVTVGGELRGYRGSSSGLATTPSWTVATVGSHLTGVGDVNKDGFDDMLVGDPTSNGTAYLFLGSASGLPAQPSWAAPSPGGSSFGYGLAAAGDVNGDGNADFLVGDSFHFYLFCGPRDKNSSTLADDGPISADGIGAAGDVDGDGFGDVLVGQSGKTYLYRGTAKGLDTSVPVTNPDDPKGTGPSMGFGDEVAGAGDLDGDGRADVAVGIPQHSTSVAGGLGRVYVFESLPLLDAGSDSGTSGSGGKDGGGAGGGAGKGGAGAAGKSGGSGDSGGCGCRTDSRSRSFSLSALSLLGFALGLLRRRRGRA